LYAHYLLDFQPVKIIALSSVQNATVITGGTGPVGTTVSNSGAAGADNVNYTIAAVVQSGSATLGSVAPGSGSVAPGASHPNTVSATSTNIGLNTIRFTASDPNASNSPQTIDATLTVVDHAQGAASILSGDNFRAMTGQSGLTATVRLATDATNGSGGTRAGLQVDATSANLSGGTIGVIPAGNSSNYTATFDTVGQLGTMTVPFSYNTGDDQNLSGHNSIGTTNISGNINGTAVANRTVTATSVDYGFVHIAAAVSKPTTLSTTSGDDNHATRVTVANVGPDANGISVTEGTNPTFSDNSVTDSRSVGGTFSSLGTKNGTISLTATGELLPGESPVNPTVSYAAQVYSGKAQWNGTGSGLWGTHTNWKDTQSSVLGGAPGVSGISGDTASVGSIISAPSVITLDAPATLSALRFDSTNAYTLGGTNWLTLQAAPSLHALIDVATAGIDSHVISAPMLIASPLDINTSTGTLTFAGAFQVSGAYTVTKTGSGTLIINGPQSWAAGSVLQIGGSGGSSRGYFGASSPNSLPEPGTVVLLGAAAASLIASRWWRRRRL